MSLSVMGAIGIAAAGAGMQGANATGSNVQNYFFGGKEEKRSNRRSEQMTEHQRSEQFKYDLAEKAYDYALAKQAYDYSNQQEYDYAQAYAANSAKWNVEGLRNAGLNPILAATDGNFRGTFGNTGSFSPSFGGGSSGQFQSAGSHFRGSDGARVDLAEAVRDVSSARQSSVASDIAEQTQPSVVTTAKNNAVRSAYEAEQASALVGKTHAESEYIRAQALKSAAEARQLESSTALNQVRMRNETEHHSISTPWQLISRVAHGASYGAERFARFARESLERNFPLLQRKSLDRMKNYITNEHSAKGDTIASPVVSPSSVSRPEVHFPDSEFDHRQTIRWLRPTQRTDDYEERQSRRRHNSIYTH